MHHLCRRNHPCHSSLSLACAGLLWLPVRCFVNRIFCAQFFSLSSGWLWALWLYSVLKNRCDRASCVLAPLERRLAVFLAPFEAKRTSLELSYTGFLTSTHAHMSGVDIHDIHPSTYWPPASVKAWSSTETCADYGRDGGGCGRENNVTLTSTAWATAAHRNDHPITAECTWL